jgi:hypothetical protein
VNIAAETAIVLILVMGCQWIQRRMWDCSDVAGPKRPLGMQLLRNAMVDLSK